MSAAEALAVVYARPGDGARHFAVGDDGKTLCGLGRGRSAPPGTGAGEGCRCLRGAAKLLHASWVQNGAPRAWWHGGVPGLTPGELLVSPDESGTASTAATIRRYGGQVNVARSDRLHVSQDAQIAFWVAAMWTICPWRPGNGAVYLVRPEAPLEPGAPWDGPEAFARMCPRAEVVQVFGTVSPDTARRWLPGCRQVEAIFADVMRAAGSELPG